MKSKKVSQALLDRIVDGGKLFLLNEYRMNILINLSSNYVKMAITELLHNLQETFFPNKKCGFTANCRGKEPCKALDCCNRDLKTVLVQEEAWPSGLGLVL